jgi:hypothetical protein
MNLIMQEELNSLMQKEEELANMKKERENARDAELQALDAECGEQLKPFQERIHELEEQIHELEKQKSEIKAENSRKKEEVKNDCENQNNDFENFKRMQLVCNYIREKNYDKFREFLYNNGNREFVVQLVSSGKYPDFNSFVRNFLEYVQDDYRDEAQPPYYLFGLIICFVLEPTIMFCILVQDAHLGFFAFTAIPLVILILGFIFSFYSSKFSENNPRFCKFKCLDDALDALENERTNSLSVSLPPDADADRTTSDSLSSFGEQPEVVCTNDDALEQHS